jgi:aspartate ammonia-lyase
MEINFEDYLSEQERKEIVASVFREKVKGEFDKERIFGNAAYAIVTKIVDEHYNGEMSQIIQEKAISIIKSLSEYTVFKRPDHWDKEASMAWKHLQSVMGESKPLIQEKVSQIIAELDQDDLRETLKEYAVELLDTKLFGGNK